MSRGTPEGADRPLPQLSLLLRNFSADDQVSWEPLLAAAEVADRAGVDRLVVSDHVAFGESLTDYARPEKGGVLGGRQPTGPDGHWLEPLTLLAVLAGSTTRVRLATGILLAALRRPVVLAKTVATLDVLSAGRVDLGVGVGWQEAEYEVAGLAFAARGRLLDETLDLCQRLWREPVVDLPSGPIHQMPKPVQAGGVPLWISGRSTNRHVVDRVIRFGAGWIPWAEDAVDPAPGIVRLREALERAGHGGRTLQVTAALPDDPGEVARLVDAGVTDFRARTSPSGREELSDLVRRFRELVC
ncbi:MAG: TIGR03619 family F420-dependent LLM class oxidoreductase [Acidimicrobiales bacterium]